ncbi:methyltransferase [Devosia pacifica]|uniref:Methyltransferase n=2 Tax=Devosia pacifica TaxID=1335967 RepID=A0A918RZP3_9HYPH|nr:methyltransferase [Devosia pacifica]
MAEDARFWNRMARRYAAQPVADQAVYEEKLHRTRRYLSSESQVLEFGCGTGSTALLHAPYVANIVAIDFSKEMISIAREKARGAGIDNVHFEVAGIEAYDVGRASFDAVLGLSVLHLVRDKQAVVNTVYTMLKPGGVFVSSTACVADTRLGFLRYVAPLGRAIGLLPFLDVMTHEALLDCHRKAGFEILEDWQPSAEKAVFVIARKPA